MSSRQVQNKGEMSIVEVIRLIGLVNYQEASVVSRTIVKRATGTCYAVRFRCPIPPPSTPLPRKCWASV